MNCTRCCHGTGHATDPDERVTRGVTVAPITLSASISIQPCRRRDAYVPRSASRPDQPAARQWRPGVTWAAMAARCRFIASVLHHGRSDPRPRRSRGRWRRRWRLTRCAGPAARRAACRVSPNAGRSCFSAQIRPSSPNQTSTSPGLRPCSGARPPPAWSGSFFKRLDRTRGLGVTARSSGQLA